MLARAIRASAALARPPRLAAASQHLHFRQIAIPPAFTQRANMSTEGSAAPPSAPIKYEWLCIMPDKEDALPRRLKVREEHLKGINKLHADGFIAFGGILLDRPIQEGETPGFKGSAMVALAASKEEVLAVLKADPYTKEDVWDWDKVEIYPFRTAIRAPMPYS
ncbi:hypothetical protein BDZ91DRAFT_712150 [Kalaharituber pfeilii]|nr:hypothetical protein BDZ91DRAFT_712150 [Kalaharituber pfeilii]